MGLSSLLVVLNSLRLGTLGRQGLDQIGTARSIHSRRGLVVSVLLPVALFAGLTFVSEALSPARGQSLLPSLPSITTVNLPGGVSAETYLDPGSVGVNQFHVIFTGPAGAIAAITPEVTATPDGGTSTVLRQLRVSSGHFSEIVVLNSGTWRFHVTGRSGRVPISFTVSRTIS
jgi:hypothetical protein